MTVFPVKVSDSYIYIINPFQPSAGYHIETSHLFCKAEQMAAFYMKRNTGLKWVNQI